MGWQFSVGLACLLLPAICMAQSVDDIRAEIDKQEYRSALAKINRALPDAKSNDERRCELLTLRGEALLQLRQKSAALEAFRTAWRAAPQDADLSRVMAARSMVELLSTAGGFTYAVKGGASIDILNPDSRKKAMAALFEERLGATKSKIEDARDATQLGPMIELMPALGGLMALEFGANGGLETMTPIIQSLGERGRELIHRELARLDDRVKEIEDASNELFILDTTDLPTRRGLRSDEAQELIRMQDYLDQIDQAAEEGRRINRRLGGTGEAWDEILLRASQVKSRARYVLAAQGQTVAPRR